MDLHRFLDAPLLLDERAAANVLLKIMRQARGLKDESDEDSDLQTKFYLPAPEPVAAIPQTATGNARSFQLVEHVAIIPIEGVLVHGTGSAWAAETGYATISQKVIEAAADDEARAIALQISSPGGEVSGLFELTDTISSITGDKPVWAILDDHAYSAAYAIASTADHVTVPRTGGTGSIGVITMHADVSKALENFGINVSIIQYGERKSDYSPFKPLANDARERLQADVNAVGEMFVKMVAKNRGLPHSRVRSTEAGIFLGQDGVTAGLADALQSPQEAFNALAKRIS